MTIINSNETKDRIDFKYFFIILTLFTGTWLISDIAAVKLVCIFGITLTGGFIIFPFTNLLGSLIVEVYGYKNARRAIWAGVTLNLTFVFFIYLIYILPSSEYWQFDEQFGNILIPGMRIVIASLISFLIAEFLNSFLMAKMKIFNKGKSLVKRITISYALSFLLDITFFLTLAFYGRIPNAALETLIAYAYLKKMLCQLFFIPIIFYCTNLLKKLEGVDIFDYDTNFSPFSLDNVYQIRTINKSIDTNINVVKSC